MKGAPIGNQFWKARSKHGTDRIFATADILFDACCEYFTWCEENSLMEHDFVGKDATEINRRKMRAFTIQGLCIFLGVNTVYFNHFKESLKGREDEVSKDFSKIITQVMDIIYNQKFTGAAAGFLNPNIIARDLGLADKKEQVHKIEEGAIIDWGNKNEANDKAV